MLVDFNEMQARTVPGMNGGTGEIIKAVLLDCISIIQVMI